MNFKNLASGAALALGIALLGLPTAHADVILTYTGNHFTTASPPYTVNDKVTASITLAAPLGDNLNFPNVSPIAYSLTDGVQTITSLSSTAVGVFTFSTDATGTITQWSIQAVPFFARPVQSLPRIVTEKVEGPFGFSDDEAGLHGFMAFNFANPGEWTSTSPAIPEPATVTVLGAGLLGLVFLRRRHRHNLDLAQ
jgi:hypothetical protein